MTTETRTQDVVPAPFAAPSTDEGSWKRRHLLDLDDFSVEELDLVMRTTDTMKEVLSREVARVPALRGTTRGAPVQPIQDLTPLRDIAVTVATRAKVKELYDLRSGFVHAGVSQLTAHGRDEVLALARRVIRREIDLLPNPPRTWQEMSKQ